MSAFTHLKGAIVLIVCWVLVIVVGGCNELDEIYGTGTKTYPNSEIKGHNVTINLGENDYVMIDCLRRRVTQGSSAPRDWIFQTSGNQVLGKDGALQSAAGVLIVRRLGSATKITITYNTERATSVKVE